MEYGAKNTTYNKRTVRSFVDDPIPWLARVGALSSSGVRGQSPEHAMVTDNIRFILWKIVGHKWKSDAFQEGALGMMRSIEKFDLDRKVRLLTYAAWWIKSFVGRMRNERFPFEIPNYLNEAVRAFVRKDNPIPWDMPDDEIIARYENWTESTVRHARELVLLRLLRIHDLVSVRDDGPYDPSLTCDDWVEWHELTESTASNPEEFLAEAEEREDLERAMRFLSERETAVMHRRYGMTGKEESLQEIGDEIGLSRERIRQIEFDAIRTLRSALRSKNPCDARDALSHAEHSANSVTHIQYACVRLLRMVEISGFYDDSVVPTEIAEASVRFYFHRCWRGALRELERIRLVSRSSDGRGWVPAAESSAPIPLVGPLPRKLPEGAVENVLRHWDKGVREIMDDHFIAGPREEMRPCVREAAIKRLSEIARRERLIESLLPRLRAPLLRERERDLSAERGTLQAERDALLSAMNA